MRENNANRFLLRMANWLKAYLHAAICLRFVVPICRPREIVKQIGACKWRPDARAISVRHVGRFGKNL